jgi:putative nucleotidyltransferase with HDIG domain
MSLTVKSQHGKPNLPDHFNFFVPEDRAGRPVDDEVTHEVHDRFQIDLGDQKVHHVFDGFLDILLNLLAHRDYTTYLHSLRVAELSRRIGIRLQLEKDEILSLEHGGLIHDIGKLSIPDDVLLKPGRFSSHDRHIMNGHPLVGAQLFEGKGLDERLIDIVLRHHERLDGSGYPDGLVAESISIYPRIVAVADVYEALIARRPYKRDHNRDDALTILAFDVRDGKLDGEVVEALVAVTHGWNPLTIQGLAYTESMARLEDFRHSSYFREPLSRYFSYRYLFSLEESRKISVNEAPYALFALCFRNLKTLNRIKGYIVTDTILSTIGEDLLRRIGLIEGEDSQTRFPTLLFLKKGADYIIYSRFEPERCRYLQRLIRDSINEARCNWGIECDCHHHRFAADIPFAEAFDLLFSMEADSDFTAD